jgi:hypothetical protein
MTKHKNKSKSKKEKKSHKHSRNPEEDQISSEALLHYSSNEDDQSQYLELNQQGKAKRRNKKAIDEMKEIERRQAQENEVTCLYTD